MLDIKSLIGKIIGAEKAPNEGYRKSPQIDQKGPERIDMEMSTLNQAKLDALDRTNSDRYNLLSIYENSVEDSQVICEMDKASAFVTSEIFEVQKLTSSKPDKKRTELLQRPWFENFLKIALSSELWGYTLAEFQEQDSKGEFSDVIVFPRKHVRPFEKIITINSYDHDGIHYDGFESDFYLLEIGKAEDLGKLLTISREIIWKTFARSDWSEYNERFGMPFITYQCDTDSKEEREQAMKMAERFGRDMVAVVGSSEQLNVTEVNSKNSSESYMTLAEFCDKQIAKLINGQTGTSDEKSFVGSAEVHERILDKFTAARLRRLQNIVNYQLFPFLIKHGYNLSGFKFVFESLKPQDIRENGKTPESDNSNHDDPESPDVPDDDDESAFRKKTVPFFGQAPLKDSLG